MRRTSRLAALALAFACSRPAPEVDPLALLPGDASLVAHVDLRALQAAPLWQHNRGLLDADPDARRTLDALARCKLPFEGLRSLDLAVSAGGLDVAAVLVGDGVGDPARITCLEEQLPDRQLHLDTTGPAPQLVLPGARGHIHGPNVLVFATPGWQQAVEALRAGTGAAVPAGPLQPQLAKIAPGRPIWFAGEVPAAAAVSLAPALSGLRQVRGALDLGDGLGVELTLVMDSEARAGATLTEVQRQFAGLGAAGVPAAILDHVSFAQAGAELTVDVRLGMAEITALHGLAEALRPAPPAAAAPAPTPAPAAP